MAEKASGFRRVQSTRRWRNWAKKLLYKLKKTGSSFCSRLSMNMVFIPASSGLEYEQLRKFHLV